MKTSKISNNFYVFAFICIVFTVLFSGCFEKETQKLSVQRSDNDTELIEPDEGIEGLTGIKLGEMDLEEYIHSAKYINEKLSDKANTEDLKHVAFSGSYNDLLDRPELTIVNNEDTEQEDEYFEDISKIKFSKKSGFTIAKNEEENDTIEIRLNNIISKEELKNVIQEYNLVEVTNLFSVIDKANNIWKVLDELANKSKFIGETVLYFIDGTVVTTNIVGEFPQTYRNNTSITNVIIGTNVTSIGNYAFYGCSGLTSVSIPDSVTNIGQDAFHDCTNLTSMTIPDNVTSIGWQAFSRCSSLTKVTIGNSVTNIGANAFFGCSNLTSVILPNSVTTIRNSAFFGCSNLTSVMIGNSVTTIETMAFNACSALTNVTIGASVTSIGVYAFNNCTNISTVYYTHSDSETSEEAEIRLKNLLATSATSINWNNIEFIDVTGVSTLSEMDLDTRIYNFEQIYKLLSGYLPIIGGIITDSLTVNTNLIVSNNITAKTGNIKDSLIVATNITTKNMIIGGNNSAYTVGENSLTVGGNGVAMGVNSFSQGDWACAFGDNSHAEGDTTWAQGNNSHAEGAWTVSVGNSSHAEGSGDGKFSHYDYIYDNDLKTLKETTDSYVPGDRVYFRDFKLGDLVSDSEALHVAVVTNIDSENKILYIDRAIFSENTTSAILKMTGGSYGSYSHSEGVCNISTGEGSHAEGYDTRALGKYSHTEGINAIATNDIAFVWNGIENQTNYSHGDGTFNINPEGGFDGVYVGNKKLSEYIAEQVQEAVAQALSNN